MPGSARRSRAFPSPRRRSVPVLVWDVYGKRTPRDEWVQVGGIKAPDAEMALVLARETHFRHKEGVAYAVKRRGATALLEGDWPAEQLGGVTDRAYRRQEGYVGVGRKLKRVREELAKRGMTIDRPRPHGARSEEGSRA
jgi:1,2-phenylacetyl-CoA epoxidase PaaB subunit